MEKTLSEAALNLARYREMRSISRRALGDMLGVAGSRIQDIERGKSPVDDDFLRKFWDTFGVDLTAPLAADHKSLWGNSPTVPPVTPATGNGKSMQQASVIAAFGIRYRAAVHKVDAVLAEKGLKPNPLLYEALKTLVVAHDVSPESLALLIGGIEQQLREGSA